ncbi:MAG: POTRA domain-containing protein [Deltaproteobacteria bacterium]
MTPSNPTDWIFAIASSLSNLLFSKTSAFILGGFLLSLPVSGESLSERIENIVTPGVTAQESKPILKALGLEVGEVVDLKKIDQAIKNFAESGKVQMIFIKQRSTQKGLELQVDITLTQKINRLDLSSIRPDIVDEIRGALMDIEVGKVLEPRAVSKVKQAIRNAYESRGYFFVEVDSVAQRGPQGEGVELKLLVNEGIPTKVSRIKISNVDKDLASEFRRAITLKIGDPFTRIALESSINSLNQYLKSNQFSDSKVDETNLNFNENKTLVEIDFVLKVGSKFQFVFKGNQLFDDNTIRGWITPDVLAQSDPIRFIEQLIQEKYREVGYHFCKVHSVLDKNKNEKIRRIRFQIDEGSKVIIDNIAVTGASEYGASAFERLFYQNAEGVLRRGVFWELGIQATCQRMIKDLEEKGYLRVSLPAPRVSFSEDKKGAELFFNVELGSQTRVSRIDILGVSEVRRKDIEPLVEIKIGDPVSRSVIERTKIDIERFYHRQGYTDVKFAKSEEIVFGEDPSKAIIRFSIEEGAQYFVGQISIDGNRVTKNDVIEREFKLQVGDKYDLEKIRQSEDELLLTGLFSKVEVIGTVDPKDNSKKNVKIAVVESKAGNGELGLGAVYEDPRFRLRGFLGMSYNNVFGLNQTASVRTEVGLPLTQKFERVPFWEYSAILGYRAPYLFEIPAVFFSQASLDNYEVGTSSGGKISNLQTRARIEERVEKKISNAVKLIYRFHRYERATTKTLVLFAPDDLGNPTNPNSPNYQPGFPPATEVVDIGSTGPGIQIDLRDDSFNPTSGSFHTLDGELAHPTLLASESVRFYMLMLRNSFYVPLPEPFGLALFAGGAFADSLDPKYSIPKARLLTDLSLGGQGSIRGFSPRIFNPQPDSVSAGFYNLRAELRSAILGDLSAAVFIDSGQIFSRVAGNSWLTGLRHDGVGVGLRYKTPVGPAVIDISQGLGRDREAIKFNFTIGVF